MSETLPHDFPIRSDEDLLEGRYTIDLMEILTDSVNLFRRHAGLYIAAGLIYALLLAGSFGLAIVVIGPLTAGFYIAGLKSIRGETVEFSDFYAGFKSFGPLVIQSLVLLTLVLVGVAFCIVPGMYLGVAWSFAVPILLERKLGWWESMTFSMKVANKQFWMILLVQLIVGSISGLLNSTMIGAVVAFPWMMLVYVALYARVFGVTRSPAAPPPELDEPAVNSFEGEV